jgi:hypothetical protein
LKFGFLIVFNFFLLSYSILMTRVVGFGMVPKFTRFFFVFFVNWFIYFILLHWVGWELGFMIFFLNLFLWGYPVSWPGHEFGRLIRVDFVFFFFQFQHWIDKELGFMIFFNFLSTRLSHFHNTSHKFSKLT